MEDETHNRTFKQNRMLTDLMVYSGYQGSGEYEEAIKDSGVAGPFFKSMKPMLECQSNCYGDGKPEDKIRCLRSCSAQPEITQKVQYVGAELITFGEFFKSCVISELDEELQEYFQGMELKESDECEAEAEQVSAAMKKCSSAHFPLFKNMLKRIATTLSSNQVPQ